MHWKFIFSRFVLRWCQMTNRRHSFLSSSFARSFVRHQFIAYFVLLQIYYNFFLSLDFFSFIYYSKYACVTAENANKQINQFVYVYLRFSGHLPCKVSTSTKTCVQFLAPLRCKRTPFCRKTVQSFPLERNTVAVRSCDMACVLCV